MGKKQKQLVGLVAVLVLLVGLWFWLSGIEQQPEEEATPPEAAIALGQSVAPDQLIEIEVTTGDERYTLKPNGESAVLVGWEDVPLNEEAATKALQSAADVQAKQLVEEDGDLALFGLASPRATVRVAAQNAPEKVILIGNEAPGGEGVYLGMAGTKNVYLAASTMLEFARSPKTSLVSAIVTKQPEQDAPALTDFVLEGIVRPSPIVAAALPKEEQSLQATFRMEMPREAGIGAEALQQIQQSLTLSADSVVLVNPTPEELDALNLTEPYSSLTLTTDDGNSISLMASQPDETGMVYLRTDKVPVVYSVLVQKLPWLEWQYYNLYEPMVLAPNIGDVVAVTVWTPEKTYRYTLQGEGEEAKALFGEQELEMSNFRRFYQTLISVAYDSHTDQRPEGDATITITYEYKAGGKDTASFYPGPTRKMFASTGGEAEFFVTQAAMDKVLADCEAVIRGEEIKVFG